MAADSIISSTDFERMVESSVGELLSAQRFRRSDEAPFRVRYERGGVFVDIEYEQSRSRELTVWLGDADRGSEPPLALPDALRATDCDPEAIERIARSQTGNPKFLERLLDDAQKLLTKFAQPFLRGDGLAFARARAIRSERARVYTAELQHRPVLEAAATAWASRDYGRVRDLLNPIRDSLDESHLRRLRFAEKRLV